MDEIEVGTRVRATEANEDRNVIGWEGTYVGYWERAASDGWPHIIKWDKDDTIYEGEYPNGYVHTREEFEVIDGE